MSFEAPLLLLGLVLVPLAALGYWLLLRRSTRYAVRYTNLEVLAAVAGRRRAWLRHLPAALLLASLATLCVAFARPTVTAKAPNERASVVLVVDVSGSMRADDVKPSRLAAAKQAMRSFLDRAPDEPARRGHRVLGRASGGRLADARPTDARRGDRAPRPGLRHGDRRCARSRRRARADDDARDRGADGGGRGSSKVLKDEDGRALASILLLSDGAQTRGLLSPGQGAEHAQIAGIPVYTIALGTDEGTILAGPPGQEQVVPVPPDRETLAAIAEYTGAETYDAESAETLEEVYESLGSRVGRVDRPREVTAMFVAGGALLLAGAFGAALVGAPRLP